MTKGATDAVIRQAQAEDAGTILRLLRELAAFQGLLHHARATEADILRDGFGERPCFECLLAEIGGQAVGLALYLQSYSTFEGRPGLYVEDLYIAEAARGRSLGRQLMAHLAKIALERGYGRIGLSVHHRNQVRGFYERLGFAEVTDWQPFLLGAEALKRLAAQG